MIFNILKRQKLIDIDKEWWITHKIEDMQAKDFLVLLKELEKEILSHEYEEDERFVTYCRRDFLRQEITNFLNENIFIGRGKYIEAYVDFREYFMGDCWISMTSVPPNLNFHNVVNNNEEYRKDGIVCLQEKEILLDIIDEIMSHIKKDMEVNNMGLFSKKNYDIDKKENVPQFVYGIPDSMRKKWEKEEKEKYEINPEDNIPQKVYGIPNINFQEKGFIKIEIENGFSDYVMILTHNNDEFQLFFINLKRLDVKNESDLLVNISQKDYDNFVNRLLLVTKNWKDNYFGNNNVSWNIKIEGSNSKRILGNGEFPSNWNQFIDLLSEYEILFKQKKN